MFLTSHEAVRLTTMLASQKNTKSKKQQRQGHHGGKKKVTDYQATGEVGSVNIGPEDP